MIEDLTGKSVGGYDIERELGRGAMGVVYKAQEATLNRPVAIKFLPEKAARDKAYIMRFQREARAVAQLNHPNVVTVYNIGQEDGRHFIAMEYVKGCVLSELIRTQGRMETRAALEIARQVAGALAAAHEAGIVHRDVKPHNIMVDPVGRAKVMDFGIAKVSEEDQAQLTREGDVIGTPAYMSPEQCRGEQVDGRSDIYSLGVVLYQMLAGRLPFRADTPVALMQKILFDPPLPIAEFNPSVPLGVTRIIDMCLAKEPAGRYADAGQMERDLSSFLQHEEFATMQAAVYGRRGPDWFDRTFGPARARRARLAILGGAGMMILLLLIGMARMSLRAGRGGGGAPRTAASIPGLVATVPRALANQPPRLAASLEPKTIDVAGSTTLQASATDPESDPVEAQVRIDGGEWGLVPAGHMEIGGLDAGTHRIEAQAVDSKGAASELSAFGLEVVNTGDWLNQAVALYTGTGGLVDDNAARELFERADALGAPLARMWKAWLILWGKSGYSRDKEKAQALASESLDAVRRLADEGNIHAAFLMGAAFDQGMGTTADPEEALRFVRIAAEAGLTPAMTHLGYMLGGGRGTRKDPKAAAELFRRASDAGDTGAMHNLGWLYIDGIGVKKNETEAFGFFQRAAGMGCPVNMVDVGTVYERGLGVEASLGKAVESYRAAARLGYVRAQDNLKKLNEPW